MANLAASAENALAIPAYSQTGAPSRAALVPCKKRARHCVVAQNRCDLPGADRVSMARNGTDQRQRLYRRRDDQLLPGLQIEAKLDSNSGKGVDTVVPWRLSG
jgi:hypothetical protein